MGTEVMVADAFDDYASRTEATLRGDLLKYSKGDWTYGKGDNALDLNKSYIVDPNEILVGWQKWSDRRVVAAELGTVASGFKAPQRASLDENDEGEWETDKSGKPQDPWQMTSIIYLSDEATGEPYTFSTSSSGGRNAVRDFIRDYAAGRKEHVGAKPIVRLGTDSYKHTEWGKIHTPTIKIVGWDDGESKPLIEAAPAAARAKTKF